MKEHYKILKLKDKNSWTKFLNKIKCPDLHFQQEYYQIFSEEGDARLFIYEMQGELILYPFIVRKIDNIPDTHFHKTFYDITSPYGYGGPLFSSGLKKETFNRFYSCFEQYCKEQNIITEFIRFHPILQNHKYMYGLINIERNSTIVYIDLSKSTDKIWNEYHRSNRKNINKALRENVSIYITNKPDYFNDFLNIYNKTMDRNKASKFYYFSTEFFNKIHENLTGNYIYVYAVKDNKIVSTELLIYNDYYIHSFLGGTLPEYFAYRPNNLLKHETMLWAKQQGIKYFILGGGRNDEDGIFRYKKNFAPNTLENYYIGKKIHNKDIFNILTSNISQTNQHNNYFPPYRR